MKDVNWIKELVLSEQELESKGMVSLGPSADLDKNLEQYSIEFLKDLRAAFADVVAQFNQLKGPSTGHIKIYGISNTISDFMLFRNGHKLIFSLSQPGVVIVTSSEMNNFYVPTTPGQKQEPKAQPQRVLKAHWGPFEELVWTYNSSPINIDHLVRYFIKSFARNSVK